MPPFNLRNLSGLLANPKFVWLPESDGDKVFRGYGYAKAYAVLLRKRNQPEKLLEALDRWAYAQGLSVRNQRFRQDNARPKFIWALTEVRPKVKKILEVLEGNGGRNAAPTYFSDVGFTGGFHAKVLWEDDTERYIYFLAPCWSVSRRDAMIGLLQLRAMLVYNHDPTRILFIDLHRQEVIYATTFDSQFIRRVRSAARKMKLDWENFQSAS